MAEDSKTAKLIFNREFGRWEVYGMNPVFRNGEPQPEFVSGSYERCVKYWRAVCHDHE